MPGLREAGGGGVIQLPDHTLPSRGGLAAPRLTWPTGIQPPSSLPHHVPPVLTLLWRLLPLWGLCTNSSLGGLGGGLGWGAPSCLRARPGQWGIIQDRRREDTASNLKPQPSPAGQRLPPPPAPVHPGGPPRPQRPHELTHLSRPTGYRSGWWCPGGERGVRVMCSPSRPHPRSLPGPTPRHARRVLGLCDCPKRWSLRRRKLRPRVGKGLTQPPSPAAWP